MVDCHDCSRKNFCITGEIKLLFTVIAAHENHLRTLLQRELDSIPKPYDKLSDSESQLLDPSYDPILQACRVIFRYPAWQII